MATNYQMDPVIRRIDKAERRAAAAEGHIVDVARDDAWFAKWYYRVARPRDDAGWTTITIERDIDAPERDWTLPIQVTLTLRFGGSDAAEARMLVDALCDADNPDRGMAILVGRWIDAFMNARDLTKVRFVERFLTLRDELKGHIVAQAAALGLTVTRAEVAVRGGSGRDAVLEIRLPNMSIVLSDYKPELQLSVDIDLSLTPGSALAYLPSGHQEAVEQEIRRAIRELFRTAIDLQRWQFELQGDVRSMVDSTLRETAARVGRQVARLVIGGKPPIEGVDRTLEIEIEKEPFRQLDYPDPVEVDVALRLDLVSLGALVNSGVPPRQVEAWARQTVRDAITHHLLDEPYVDLFDRFQAKNAQTEQALQAAAASIGYRLTRTALQTNLDFDVLQRGFACRIENAPFPLALRECQVNLDIDTRLRITDRATLRELFKKNTGITQTVSERIRETVAGALRQVRPEEFYLRFYGDGQSSEASVASRLEDAIRAACEAFKPDGPLVVDFALRPDELMKVYQLLVQTPIVLPGLKEPNTEISVDVRASVTEIYDQHWLRFQELRPTPERVSETVSEHIASFINEAAHLNLKSFFAAGAPAVKVMVQQWVNQHLGRDLGVGITIVHWLRRDPFVKGLLRNWEQEVEDLLSSLTQLSGQQRLAYVQDGPVAEIEARKKLVKDALQALYDERGTGSLMTPADSSFLIAGPTAKSVLAIAPAPPDAPKPTDSKGDA